MNSTRLKLFSEPDALIAAGGAKALTVGDTVTAAGGVALTKTSQDSFFFEAAKTSPSASSEAIEIQHQEPIIYSRAQRLIAKAAATKVEATKAEVVKTFSSVDSSQDLIKIGDWVKVIRKPRLATGVKRGEIFQVLRVNSFCGFLVIENPHENPKLILSARLGFLHLSEVCLVPRLNRLDTPAFIELVHRNFPDCLQELLQNPSSVEPLQDLIEVQVQEPIKLLRPEFVKVVDAEGHGFLPGTADDYFSKPRNCALRPGERVVEFGSVVIKPIEVQVQELIAQAVETPSGAEIDSVQEPIAPSVETPSGVETDSVQEAIAPAVETSSGVETDLVSEAIAQAAKTSPGVEVNQIQETIAQVVETSLGVEVDQVQEGIEFFTVSPRRSFESFDDSMSFLEVLQLCRDVEKTLESKSLGELQRLVSKIVKVKPGCHCLSVAGKKKHRSTWVRSAKLELSNLVQMRGFAKTPRGLGGLEPILCWEILWESEDLIIRDYDALILLVQEAIAQVVETSPVVEVDQVSEAIVQVAETSPGLQVEQVQQAIEVQVQEPIESKFGRIVYPKAAAEPIAPAAKNLTPGGINETRPNIDRTGSADLHQRCLHSTQPDGNNSGIETETLGSRKGDRVLAVSGDSQADRRRLLPNQSNELTATIFTDEQPSNRGDGRGRVESEVKVNQSAISPDVKISVGVEADRPQKSKFSIAHQLLDLFKSSVACSQDSIELAAKTPPGVETDYLLEPIEIPPGVTFSPRFLSLYSPPQSENISYKADADGQLSLLDFEVQSESEFPDPDDFESLDDFRQAIALWDIEHPESLEVSLDSFTYQADYELAESSEVMEFSSAILAEGCVNESSSTYNFSIPTFDAWCDRTSRNSSDEPPTAGVGARRPKPKPPSFPPMVVAAGDRVNRIKKFARSATLAGGRAPPGGDATQM